MGRCGGDHDPRGHGFNAVKMMALFIEFELILKNSFLIFIINVIILGKNIDIVYGCIKCQKILIKN